MRDTTSADPLAHIVQGWPRFRRYAPRMLRALEIQASGAGEPILAALRVIGAGSRDMPCTFLRRNSRWYQHLNARPAGDRRLWEVAALSHMRDAFRYGDLWLAHSRRYGDVKSALAPIEAVHATARLAVPFEPREWLAEHKVRLVEGLDRLADAAHHGRIPGGAIENGELRIGRPATAVPEDAGELVLDLYRRLPEVRITDMLLEVDAATGFTDAFTHLRTGAPCQDRIGLLNVLLAEGLNLGLSKMAEASNTHDFFQLSRLSRWHIESEAMDRALAMVIEAQAQLPMASYWSLGLTASSDGQFFPAARQGEAMNLVNARYGSEPGLKAYTHVSDRFGPFATQTIPATVNEAPYILDGLLMTRAGRRIRVQAGVGSALHIGVEQPVDDEERSFDPSDFAESDGQFVLARIGRELSQQLARRRGAAGQGGSNPQDVRPVPHGHVLPDFVAGQSGQGFRNSSGLEDMQSFRRQVPDARDEPVAEQGCDGEDMAGETAGVGVLLADAPPGPGHQQPVENIGRFVDRGRDCLCCEGSEPVRSSHEGRGHGQPDVQELRSRRQLRRLLQPMRRGHHGQGPSTPSTRTAQEVSEAGGGHVLTAPSPAAPLRVARP